MKKNPNKQTRIINTWSHVYCYFCISRKSEYAITYIYFSFTPNWFPGLVRQQSFKIKVLIISVSIWPIQMISAREKKIHRSRQIKFVLMKSITGACTRIIHIIYNRITSNPKYKPAHNTAELFRRRSKCSVEVIDVTSRISSDLETLKIWSYTTFQFSSKDIELLQQTSPYLQ